MTFGAGNPGPRLAQARTRLRAAPGLSIWLLALALGGCIGDPFAGTQPEGATSAAPSSAAPSSVTPSSAAPAEAPAGTTAPDAATALAISLAPAQMLQPAPEVFSSEEWALWDGQRTMGGRWIALPDIAMSRRVRITHLDTGASTDGALILRDSGLAGPRLIVSSEAAQALGLRPGVAAGVEVVALEFTAPPAPAAPAASENPVADALETGGSASAEGAQPGPLPVARPVRHAADTGAPQPATAPLPPSGPSGPVTPPPAPAAARAAQAGAAAAGTPRDTPVDPAPAGGDAIADGFAYIQAGIFADPDNAARLISRLQEAGLPAGAVRIRRGSRDLTRVLVGPFDSVEARDRALETVRQIGPEDAIPVRG